MRTFEHWVLSLAYYLDMNFMRVRERKLARSYDLPSKSARSDSARLRLTPRSE